VDGLLDVASVFAPGRTVIDVREHGSGNVNDTYLVKLSTGRERHFILQRINTHVFHRPEWIMLNMRTFTEHIQARLEREEGTSERRWEIPRVLQSKDGQDYYVDPCGSFWRAITFVAGAECYDTVQDAGHAHEAGYALGRFHALLSDLDPAQLYDTLSGFHVTPHYLAHYEEALEGENPRALAARSGQGDRGFCARFVEERRDWASVLQDALEEGKLTLRPIHGDPKINNFMIDENTGRAISLIDLDTVKPGLVHYDIGDCLRSCCNPLGEETNRLDEVRFDVDLCRAILQGYLQEAKEFLTADDYDHIYNCIRLIAFELGLRFYTDDLEGNVYFKVQHPEHNLWRALVQFKLTESIEAQEDGIRAIVSEMRGQKEE
jgi:Ser/Thr protein kinase RdoA (MazF antagonist)